VISIIISSYREDYFSALEKNIEKTIGVAYEIVKVDNAGKMGICEAYNTGANKARYPYLCFIHEDVQFITGNWGINLIDHFMSDMKVGVIGLAGSICKCKMVSSWWQQEVSGTEPKRTNYLQYYPGTQKSELKYLNPLGETRSAVATLDGVFLAARKEVWKEIRFDQELLKGFHAYDMDFTLRAGERYTNYVVYDILLEHYSEGVADKDWFIQNFLVHRKNARILPVIKTSTIKLKDLKQVDKNYLVRNLDYISAGQVKRFKAFQIFLQLIYNSKLFKPNRTFLKAFLKSFNQH